jgi:hypothetical protein
MLRAFLVFIGVFLSAFVSGCIALPQQELAGYISAFSEARTSGETLYLELNRSLALASAPEGAGNTQNCTDSQNPPRCFDPDLYLSGASATLDPDIAARIAAFEAILVYNDTLSALASGASGAAVAKRIGELGGLLGKAALVATGSPAAGDLGALVSGAALPSLETLAREISAAANAEEARRLVLAGRPVIDALISSLIEDTTPIYAVYSTSQGKVVRRIPGAPLSPESREESSKIAIFHKSLQAYVVLLGVSRESLGTFASAVENRQRGQVAVTAALDQAVEIRLAADEFRRQVDQLQD